MSRLLKYFLNESKDALTVLTATSGDTGSAVANAFFDDSASPKIRVVVLFPKGKVSPLQERQMTTLGKNIHAIEVAGTFDDCQKMVKEALQSVELTSRHHLTSANSINLARLLPQALYYIYSYLLLPRGKHPVFSVPSGNLGNLTGGILAHLLGMPITHFVAACNENDVFPEYLSSGTFSPRKSVATCSNAMDVGNPSNFLRLSALFKNDKISMCKTISGFKASDLETVKEIRRIYELFNYQVDPHTAVGVLGLRKFLTLHSLHPSTAPGIVLATAHPAKFSATMKEAIDEEPLVPKQLAALMDLPTRKKEISPSLTALEVIFDGLATD
jgi:threonine synthase